MKIAVSSILGPPRDPRTWSNAPAHLIDALEAHGVVVTAIDTQCLTAFDRALMACTNVVRGRPAKAVSWLASSRRKRARHLAQTARQEGCDLVLCTGSLDAPVDQGVPYAIWHDNTIAQLQRSPAALPFDAVTMAEIERLERAAFHGAQHVLTFSKHLRDSVINDYGVPADRVHAVGCGSGPLRVFEGAKTFGDGHLLFVAKHLFASKGGDLVLEAFPLIKKARPQTKLILIGNDEARVKAAGIDGVEVHGFVARETLNEYFHQAAMLVQPMFSDPWGQVYLEAMKARAVVVSLNVAALPELTDDGRLGVLVDLADPQALADAVLATYARPQNELDALTHQAQARVLDEHNWNEVARRIMAALDLKPRSTQTDRKRLENQTNQPKAAI